MIDQLEGVGVLDAAIGRLPGQTAPVAQHIHPQQRALGQLSRHRGRRIRRSSPPYTAKRGRLLRRGIPASSCSEAKRIRPTGLATRIITSSQASTHRPQLMHWYWKPVTDIDAGGAHLHADAAVDAVAAALALARFAAGHVIADGARGGVEHHALETRVRAHVLAHRLAGEAGLHVGEQARRRSPRSPPTAPRFQLATAGSSSRMGVK
jgi:hypothetical protein